MKILLTSAGHVLDDTLQGGNSPNIIYLLRSDLAYFYI